MLSIGLKDGGWGHKPQNARDLEKLEKVRKQIHSWGLQKSCSCTNTLILGLLTFRTVK